MDPALWERIEKVFDELLELAPDERRSRLDRLQGADVDLRAELERLLEADSGGRSGILDRGIAPLAGDLLGAEEEFTTPTGRLIGPYRVLDVLGRGGMGEVLLAERADGEFEHRVALKVVPGDHLHPKLDLRLRHERQILARLRHPNIAALYDGGVTETGSPYFAMEIVEGRPITEYCDQHRLSVDARLRLFDSVCRAIQFAHRNLVIHRDIKPSNVLVTSDGTVKLLDFGIAKLIDDHEATQTGDHYLTPASAAPEQLRGQPATTATDVYALGVLLYELLAGRRPHVKTADSAVMIRAILEEEPARASDTPTTSAERDETGEIARLRSLSVEELRRQLRGDLDIILDKALRKDPDERYASAEELRQDLQRHRDSLPVAARPATRSYRVRKFVRRHRVGVTLGSLALAALLGFAIWVGVLFTRAEENLDRALSAENSTAREAETLRQVTDFLTELFEVASPDQSHGREVTARELLDAGAERIAADLDTEPSVRASMQLTMAASYRWLGLYEEALPLAEAAAAGRRELFGETSAEFGEAQMEIAWLQIDLGHLPEAETAAREAVAILESTRGAGHPDLADAALALGQVLLHQGRFAEARVATQRALTIFEAVPEPNPESIAHASNDLAVGFHAEGNPDQAGDMFARAIAAHVDAGDTTHPNLGYYMTNLGTIRTRQGRFGEAEELTRRALEIAVVALGEDHVDLADQHNSLGRLYHRMGRHDEAEQQFLRSIEIWRANVEPDHPKVVWTLDNLAACLIDAGRLEEADAISVDVVRMSEKTVGVESVYHGAVLTTQADLRAAQGRWTEAVALLRASLPTYEAELGPDHPTVAQQVLALGSAHAKHGQRDEAEAHFRRALAIYEATKGADSEEATMVREQMAKLGGAASDAGKPAERAEPPSGSEEP